MPQTIPNSDKRLLLAAHYPGGLDALDIAARQHLADGDSPRVVAAKLTAKMQGVTISHTTVRAWYVIEAAA